MTRVLSPVLLGLSPWPHVVLSQGCVEQGSAKYSRGISAPELARALCGCPVWSSVLPASRCVLRSRSTLSLTQNPLGSCGVSCPLAAVWNPFKAASRPIVGPPSRFLSLRGRCLPVPDVQCPKLFHVCSNFSCSSGRADLVLDTPSCLGQEQRFPSFLLTEDYFRAQPLSDSPC